MLDWVDRRESLKVSSWEKAERIRSEIEEGSAYALCMYSAILPILAGIRRLNADRLKRGGIKTGGRG